MREEEAVRGIVIKLTTAQNKRMRMFWKKEKKKVFLWPSVKTKEDVTGWI